MKQRSEQKNRFIGEIISAKFSSLQNSTKIEVLTLGVRNSVVPMVLLLADIPLAKEPMEATDAPLDGTIALVLLLVLGGRGRDPVACCCLMVKGPSVTTLKIRLVSKGLTNTMGLLQTSEGRTPRANNAGACAFNFIVLSAGTKVGHWSAMNRDLSTRIVGYVISAETAKESL